MKQLFTTGLVALAMWLVSFDAAAQEMSFRSGVVTDIAPIQVEVKKEQKTVKQSALGRAMGRVGLRAVSRAVMRVGGEHTADVIDVGASAVQDGMNASVGSDGGKTATSYMVIVRFDDGRESAIQSADATSLSVGSRVRVFGSGSSARIVAQ